MNMLFTDCINAVFPSAVAEKIASACYVVNVDPAKYGEIENHEHKVRVKIAKTPVETHCLQREALWLQRLGRIDLCAQRCYSLERRGPLTVLVTSYVPGISLNKLLQTSSLSTNKQRGIITQFIIQLESLHTAEFVHGDIKPSNVIHHEEQGISLIDFSNTRRLGSTLIERDITQLTPSFQYPVISQGAVKNQDRFAALVMIYMLIEAQFSTTTTSESLRREADLWPLMADFYEAGGLKELALDAKIENTIMNYFMAVNKAMQLSKCGVEQ